MNRTPSSADWKLPAIIGLAVLMQTLSATVVLNALPEMSRSFGVELLSLNWAVTVYMAALGAALPVTGWMADRFGARRVFMAAIAGYALSSAAAGCSVDLTQLLAARFVQGVASSALLPVGRLILFRAQPKSAFVTSLAVLSTATLLGPMLGPIVGGALVTYATWRWIFFINLPIAAIGLILVARHVPNVRERIDRPLDLLGAALTALATTAFILGVEQLGSEQAGSVRAMVCFGASIAAILIYVWHAGRVPNAIMDLSILRDRSFSAAVVGGSFSRIGVGANPFLLVMLLQIGFGKSAFDTGIIMASIGAGAILSKLVAKPLLKRFGFKAVLLGNGCATIAVLMMPALFTPTWAALLIMLVLGVSAFVLSIQMTCINGLAYADLDEDRMSAATTTAAMGQYLVQTFGIALAASLLRLLQQWQDVQTLSAALMAPAFVIAGLLAGVSLLWFARLPADVGDEMSGRGSFAASN